MGHADLMTVVADVILHTVVVFFYDARSHRKNDAFTTENANAPFVVVSISRRCHSSGGHHVEHAFLWVRNSVELCAMFTEYSIIRSQ